MILYYTPKSHFSRKVRILLDLLEVSCELRDIGNVAESQLDKFNNNPLMKVPVLEDENVWLIDSDHIASYIVRKYFPTDNYEVLTNDLFDLNARAVMNGIMLEEVKVILAQRTGVPTGEYSFFKKSLKSIEQGLEWIEKNIENFDNKNFKYRDFHLLCLWEHLKHYDLISLNYPKIEEFLVPLSQNSFIGT